MRIINKKKFIKIGIIEFKLYINILNKFLIKNIIKNY